MYVSVADLYVPLYVLITTNNYHSYIYIIILCYYYYVCIYSSNNASIQYIGKLSYSVSTSILQLQLNNHKVILTHVLKETCTH